MKTLRLSYASDSLLLLFSSFWFIISCAPNDQSSEINNGEVEMEIVNNYLRSLQNQDIEAMRMYLSNDFRSYGPALNDSSTLEEAMDNWESSFNERIDSLSYNRTARKFFTVTIAENPVLAGSWVLEWGTMHLRYKAGQSATVWWHGVYRVMDGKISTSRVFMDRADLLTQRGYTFTQPVIPEDAEVEED